MCLLYWGPQNWAKEVPWVSALSPWHDAGRVSTRGIRPGASFSLFTGTFSHPGLMWNLVSGSEGKKDRILSGPLSLGSLSYIPFPLLPFFLLPSPFSLAWCLKLPWSSFLPHATTSSRWPDLALHISYRPLIATAEVLLMDCIRTTWALHVWTTLSKEMWSWSQTQISRQLKINFLIFVDGIIRLPSHGLDWFPLSVNLL